MTSSPPIKIQPTIPATGAPSFELSQMPDGLFFWALRRPGRVTMLLSNLYITKREAQESMQACLACAAGASNYGRLSDYRERRFFILLGPSGLAIAASGTFLNEAAREYAIGCCQLLDAFTAVIDRTVRTAAL